jgi:hypothetical protein
VRSAFPPWLRTAWLIVAPLAIVMAARIGWEKTVWTWTRGPQAVGFSLMHVHPLFSILGLLCCISMMVWQIPAISYLVARWKSKSMGDISMLVISILITIAIVLPDKFFA